MAPAITNGAGVLHEAERTHSTNQNHASAQESNADSDDGDEDVSVNLTSWKKRRPTLIDINFLGTSGNAPAEILTPLQYFKHFFGNQLLEHITKQSNLYCIQQKVKHNLKCKQLDTTKNEIEQFIGVLLFMGIYQLPQYRMYWSPAFRLPQITESLNGGVNRFESLKRFLHFNNNTNLPDSDSPDRDKLFKIRPVVDALLEKCQQLEPEEYNSVNEQIIPTKCRSSLKQYMPKKPNKWGYKVFTRCGVKGMIYNFEIYCGKNKIAAPSTNLGVTGDLVMRLCENLPHHQRYKVFFDNYFTSIPLMKELFANGILALGTIRQNRMIGAQKILTSEKELKKKGRGARDWRVDLNSNIVVMKWMDNSVVHLASTFVDCSLGENVRRWSAKEKDYIDIVCPTMVHEYNKFMGGVDLNDMLLSLYHIKLRTRKWHMPIFFYLVKVAVTNGWLLYCRHVQAFYSPDAHYMPLLEFQAQIASGLTQAGKLPARVVAKRGRPSASPLPVKKSKTSAAVAIPQNDVRYDGCGHFAVFEAKQHRCRFCCKGYTHMQCVKCKLFLCTNRDRNCFLSFHSA